MAISVVIAGCGFGGLEAAYNLKRMLKDKIRITAIDRDLCFTYLPGLPDLAGGAASEQSITIDYEMLFRRIGSKFVRANITSIDTSSRKVATSKGMVSYDYLIISLGSESAYYGIKGAAENTLAFKSASDANSVRRSIVDAFASQKGRRGRAIDPSALRIAIVGGGLTGVELAAALRGLTGRLCRENGIPESKSSIVLVDHGKILHPSFNERVGEYTERYLRDHGVRLLLGRAVTEARKGELLLDNRERVKAQTIVWCAGIKPSEVVDRFEGDAVNPKYGLVLNSYLQMASDPRVFSIGDCSYCRIFEAFPILTALRATEQAEFVSENLYYEITGQHDRKVAYVPRRFPTLVSLSGGSGILVFDGFWMKGRFVWMMKRATQRVYMARYRHSMAFLEYVDEFFISMIAFMYFMRMRRP